MVQIHEEAAVYGGKLGWNIAGLSKNEVIEIIPELIITEEQSKLIDETGWNRFEEVETTDGSIKRSKEVISLFKEMAKSEMKDKTLLAVSHGYFLHALVYVLSAQSDETVKKHLF